MATPPQKLGLPPQIAACLFDLDGVLTKTAALHAKAWKQMFDDFLRARSPGGSFVPFDLVRDYDLYVDGKPRDDGTRSFLASRSIDLAEGSPDDPPGTPTIHGLGNRKNELVLRLMHDDGVATYEGSMRYLQAVRDAGLRSAVVSSSRNCRAVLALGRHRSSSSTPSSTASSPRSKRWPASRRPTPTWRRRAPSASAPHRCAVFEDALAGVEAGRAGGLRLRRRRRSRRPGRASYAATAPTSWWPTSATLLEAP